jgi:phosphohistidine phosphatase
MKRVFIVRHAKSVHYGYDDDFNRDLQERGTKDARLVSRELNRLGIKADAMISSPAVRALKTARIFADNMDFKKKNIREMEEIYEGLSTSDFIDIINVLPDDIETAFFFGHNPDFHYITRNLLKYYNEEMPTCAAVGIDFDVDKWKYVKSRTGKQFIRLVPEMLK